MNLQQIFRAAVCAAGIALFITGAKLFPSQSVAGKETRSASLSGAAALDQLKRDGQYDSLQNALNQARFSVSRAENTPLGRAAWRAPNSVAGYDAYITETGVSIAINNDSYVSLSLRSLGYGADVRTVSPGEVFADKQTINLTRAGGVREWYVNGPNGLEQGFTLSDPPGARQSGAPLRLALQVGAGWRAAAREDGRQVTLRNAKGQTVEYGKLFARDSLGRDVPSRLTVDEEQVVIEVEDSKAAYPLTIDPFFVYQQKLLAADGANSGFGVAVALDGDTLVVGALGGEGAAYVFTRSGEEPWTLQQTLTVAAAALALDGDTLVVGAPGDDIGANVGQGSVSVFTRSSGVWAERQKLTAGDGEAGDAFGWSVALDGDALVVGALDNIGENSHQGSAYIFTRDNGVWTEGQKLTASDGEKDDNFGWSVALDGPTLVVGAFYDKIGANARQGSVYVFTRSGATSWTFQQKFTASDGETGNLFGVSVALDGETLVVGADHSFHGLNTGQGSAYVFTRNDGVWTQQQKLTPSGAAPGNCFGGSVALSGDTLSVGARCDDIGANLYQGSAYVFTRSGGLWIQRQKLTASDGGYGDYFGRSVALSSDMIVVGSPFNINGANLAQGSVYVFYRPPCESLAITPASLPNGPIGIEYRQFVRVNSPGSYNFAISNGALPPGLSLSSGGLLSGNPTTQGIYQFTIGVTDLTSSCYLSRDYTITIEPPCLSLAIDPPTLQNGWKGSFYYETLTGMYGIDPYTFTKKSGLLPPGLNLSAQGVLSGTPTQTGLFKFTVQVSDSTGCIGTAPYSISITRPGIEFSSAPDAKRGAR